MKYYAARLGRLRILCVAGALSLLLTMAGTSVRAATHAAAPLRARGAAADAQCPQGTCYAGTLRSPAPITIGFSLSLTGDFSADGLAFEQGYNLWAAAVNKSGGLLGRPVKLIMISDASSPTQVVTDYQKLITVDHVDLVFGPFSTLLTKPASVIANRYGYAFVEGAGGGPSVFTRGLHNVFDVSLPVANNLVSFAHWILSLSRSMRPKTAAYASEDDPFTVPQLDAARAILEKGGVRTVYNKIYPAEPSAYTPIAVAVVHSQAQVALFGTLLPDIVAFIQTFRQQHYNPQALIATAGPDQGTQFIKAVGLKNTEGVFVPNGGWYPGAPTYQNAAMVKAYLAKYGGTPDAISSDVAEAYAVGQVVAQAVTTIGSLNNAALIKELHRDTFNSVQGRVKFDPTGQNVAAQAYLFQWQKGSLLPVFPASVARARPEFPKPHWR
jgi:branched-chain amino acid transport system substrate-binding protein